jgi:preprotein translocase subunit SecE
MADGKSKKFYKDTIAELKKVVWPNRQQVTNNTVAVLGFVAVVGLFIWVFDLALTYGFDKLFTSLK